MPPRHRFLEPIHNVKEEAQPPRIRGRAAKFWSSSLENAVGGASRDRTGDLKLAKLALSQLSYGPSFARLAASFGGQARWCSARGWLARRSSERSEVWWAEKELNLRPHAYQACALTT